jgi:hypothetical protein
MKLTGVHRSCSFCGVSGYILARLRKAISMTAASLMPMLAARVLSICLASSLMRMDVERLVVMLVHRHDMFCVSGHGVAEVEVV